MLGEKGRDALFKWCFIATWWSMHYKWLSPLVQSEKGRDALCTWCFITSVVAFTCLPPSHSSSRATSWSWTINDVPLSCRARTDETSYVNGVLSRASSLLPACRHNKATRGLARVCVRTRNSPCWMWAHCARFVCVLCALCVLISDKKKQMGRRSPGYGPRITVSTHPSVNNSPS